MRLLHLVLACLLVTAAASLAHAQDATPPPEPTVTEVEPAAAGLAGNIRVHVTNLPAGDRDKKLKEYSGWVLYLDGQPMPGLMPTSVDLRSADFYFALSRDGSSPQSAAAWKRAYAGAIAGRNVSVSVGPPTGGAAAVPLPQQKFRLVLLNRWRAALGLLAYVGVIALFVLAGWRTNMLRSPSSGAVKTPYSLSRTQLAWWVVVVVGAYLFLGLGTANWTSAFSTTALILIGIATATSGASTGVDAIKRPDPEGLKAKVLGLQEREDQLKGAATKADPASAPSLAAQTQEAVEAKERAKVDLASATAAAASVTPSDNFALDIASDKTGVVVHRLQAIIWNVILGCVFIALTARDLAMPEFDTTLLVLMGVSSTAYVGLKVPEKT